MHTGDVPLVSYCPMHRGCTSSGVTVPCTGDVRTSSGDTVPCTGDVPLVELLSHAQGMYLWLSYCPMHRGCTYL